MAYPGLAYQEGRKADVTGYGRKLPVCLRENGAARRAFEMIPTGADRVRADLPLHLSKCGTVCVLRRRARPHAGGSPLRAQGLIGSTSRAALSPAMRPSTTAESR